ncbi:MAG: 50S ribosomal protein L1, partial [Candidatus Omnitrophica bacterium]|nr:50S ribosomal protein L1 [Candidatus Omnitrophota bacterium]
MRRRSKRYKEAQKQIPDKNKLYTIKEAIEILKRLPSPKFCGSVDLHFQLNIDPKKSDQMVRGTVILPHGTGKKIRIAVFCKGEA